MADIARAARIPDNGARSAVDHFVREGILATQKDGSERIVRFDDSWRCTPLLRDLLEAMMPAFRDIAGSAKAQRLVREARNRTKLDSHPAFMSKVPIGTTNQSLVLHLLARDGALRITELAAAGAIGMRSARTAAESLATLGLVVLETVGRPPKRSTWVALNERSVLTRALREYVRSMDEPRHGAHLPPTKLKRSSSVRGRLPRGNSLRTRIIAELVRADGEGDVASIAAALDTPSHKPIRGWAESLRDAGFIQYGLQNGRMTLRLPDDPRVRRLAHAVSSLKP